MTPSELLNTSAIYCAVFLMVTGCLMLIYMLYNMFFSVVFTNDGDEL